MHIYRCLLGAKGTWHIAKISALDRVCQEVTSWMLTINRKALGGSMWYGFDWTVMITTIRVSRLV